MATLKLPEEYKHDKNLEVRDFLYLFLTKLNRDYVTLYVKDETIQCYPRCHRSLGDITEIVNYYYDDKYDKDDIYKLLLSFNEKLVGHYCGTIEKRVYEHKDKFPSWIQGGTSYEIDEYERYIFYRDKAGNLTGPEGEPVPSKYKEQLLQIAD